LVEKLTIVKQYYSALLISLIISILSISTAFSQIEILYENPNFSKSIFVLTTTKGYVHKDAIPAGKNLIKKLGKSNNFEVYHSKNPESIESIDFMNFDAIVFLCTTLNIFNENQQEIFKSFIQSGKGFVGIHSAADTEYDWSWYGNLVGAYFVSHPKGTPKASIQTSLEDSFFTSHLNQRWEIEDEWYNYDFKNANIIPLLYLDETTYEGGKNGSYHPIAWYHEFDGGRSFYTGMGHAKSTYEDSRFQKLLLKGILYAME
tara:strand:- start:1227 stop:2006 length:780 start_codon:yes stop_codon:yes gene_type:complete